MEPCGERHALCHDSNEACPVGGYWAVWLLPNSVRVRVAASLNGLLVPRCPFPKNGLFGPGALLLDRPSFLVPGSRIGSSAAYIRLLVVV